jgi:hypothetical protein
MFHETEARLASQALRPRDLALLLLASGDLRPRKRARDQQADVIGLELKRAILERLADLDPESADLDAALVRIIEEMSTPTGPARAVARVVREEWQMACAAPEWVAQLLAEALQENARGQQHGGQSSP